MSILIHIATYSVKINQSDQSQDCNLNLSSHLEYTLNISSCLIGARNEWVQTAKLIGSDYSDTYASINYIKYFGYRVDITNNYAVVGKVKYDYHETGCGGDLFHAYVFKMNSNHANTIELVHYSMHLSFKMFALKKMIVTKLQYAICQSISIHKTMNVVATRKTVIVLVILVCVIVHLYFLVFDC